MARLHPTRLTRPQARAAARAAARTRAGSPAIWQVLALLLLGAALLLPTLLPGLAQADSRLLAQARRGDAVAAEMLAAQYETGAGMPRNLSEAARWYRQAAEAGSRNAQFAIGQFLETGTGITADAAAAARWYLKAARQRHAGAAINLAGMLATGRGVAADRLSAYRLLLQAQDFPGAAGVKGVLDANIEAIGAGLSKSQRDAATPLDPAMLALDGPAAKTASAARPAH